MTIFRGLTWDHPRGYDALAAASVRMGGRLEWDKQSLEGFESAPIADLCKRYDIVVMDHPHLGEALREGCLQPWDDHLAPERLLALEAATIGPSLASYRMAGKQWALPLDAATHVMARRADLVETAPDDWDGVVKLASGGGVALSWAGPHAILSFFSVCLAEGDTPGGASFCDDAIGRAAIERLAELCASAPAGTDRLNPIGLLNAMSEGSQVALVPLVYGYVTYAAPNRMRPITFSNAPRGAVRRGSVLGGTGIALSTRARPDPDLIEHLDWLLGEEAQIGFLPPHSGQPGLRAAWNDEYVNAAWGNFYKGTAATVENAWVRPRFDGYIVFQHQGSAILREGIAERASPQNILSRLRTAWNAIYRAEPS